MNPLEAFLQTSEGGRHSRSQWAAKFGVTPSFVAHLTSDARLPSLATAYRIEKATGGLVTMQSWLERGNGDSVATPAETAAPAH